jgi:hypothetical protein
VGIEKLSDSSSLNPIENLFKGEKQMKKTVLVATLLASAAFSTSIAFAGEAYTNYSRDQSAMSGQSIMDIGAASRAHTEQVINSSRADMARSSAGVNSDFQFGASQSEQSWKSVKTPDKAPVHGLVPGDCRGDNTSDAYRKQMGQQREGFTKETLVPQNECESDHATVGGVPPAAGAAHH